MLAVLAFPPRHHSFHFPQDLPRSTSTSSPPPLLLNYSNVFLALYIKLIYSLESLLNASLTIKLSSHANTTNIGGLERLTSLLQVTVPYLAIFPSHPKTPQLLRTSVYFAIS